MLEPMPHPAQAEYKAAVLVVEDNVSQRFILTEWLRTKGYLVLEAASAKEAEVLLASHHHQVDVVITDIWMPGMTDGFDLVNYLRRAFPQTNVITISGIYQHSDLEEKAPFLRKPVDLEEISALVDRLVEGKPAHGN